MSCCGVPSPKYVRSVRFENQSGKEVDVVVHFESGQTQNYHIGTEPVEVQREINHGSHTSVDPVQSWSLNLGEGQVNNVSCQDGDTVERRTYVIHANLSVERKHD